MAASLEAATGTSVAGWVAKVEEAGIDGFTTIVNWLKQEHGLGHFQGRLVAQAHRDRHGE